MFMKKDDTAITAKYRSGGTTDNWKNLIVFEQVWIYLPSSVIYSYSRVAAPVDTQHDQHPRESLHRRNRRISAEAQRKGGEEADLRAVTGENGRYAEQKEFFHAILSLFSC